MILLVNEIFRSIQGETTTAGFPSLFIRLTGCNLNCTYCDTNYARTSGLEMTIDEILAKADFNGINHITITGGEPLIQDNSIDLMQKLLDLNYSVQLETNGTISLRNVPGGIRKIVDIKTPSSGEAESFLMENLLYLDGSDEIKFVLSDKKDYLFAKEFILKNLNHTEAVINLSPVHDLFPADELAGLIILDRLPVRLNLQIHKILWPDGEPGSRKEQK